MSKMGQELDIKLDENKYKMYEAIQDAIVAIEDGSPSHAHFALTEAIKEII